MPHKKKLLKRKIRRTRVIRDVEPTPTSRSDALISSMESLIRKMASAPTTPSTIIRQPSTPQPVIQPHEPTKEEIFKQITTQREIDALKNKLSYMYDKINDDIDARIMKGEAMAKAMVNKSQLKPQDYNISADDETFKVQKRAAENQHQAKIFWKRIQLCC